MVDSNAMKPKFVVAVGVLAVLMADRVMWAFTVGRPTAATPAAQAEEVGCCVTGD